MPRSGIIVLFEYFLLLFRRCLVSLDIDTVNTEKIMVFLCANNRKEKKNEK